MRDFPDVRRNLVNSNCRLVGALGNSQCFLHWLARSQQCTSWEYEHVDSRGDWISIKGYSSWHPETLCRLGGVFKRMGDLAFDVSAAQPTATDATCKAAVCYRKALDRYRTVYQNDPSHYYSGINAATLLLLLGNPADSKSVAEALLKDLNSVKTDWGDEEVWVLATQGEASLLCGNEPDALDFYRAAVWHHAATAHARGAMKKQVERIRKVSADLVAEADDWDGLFLV